MSSDDLANRIARRRRELDNMSNQVPHLTEKMEALFLPRIATERSIENNPAARALTPEEMAAHYRDLEASLSGFLKALGKRPVEEAGSSSQAAPPAAQDN